ncbi:MAG: hypothetical protein M1816_002594 [Peltula sp. TS41687]|nr:MAG: hypothetical protein M1816_002594 [Peltula sp. TS41687]
MGPILISSRRASSYLRCVSRTQKLNWTSFRPGRDFSSRPDSKETHEERHGSKNTHQANKSRFGAATLSALGFGLVFYGIGYGTGLFNWIDVFAESNAENRSGFDFPRGEKGVSKEDRRELLSSQHLQVTKSWEKPGVYAWGSNSGRVVAPDSEDAVVKSPRRIPFFDGVLLRDLKLDRDFGAAITEKGDLLQWGKAYSISSFLPTVTLRGKNLVSLALSRDRILALSANGTVYSIPVSQSDQPSGPKLLESSWLPFWSIRSNINYRTIKPKDLAWGEKVCSISSGLDHVLLLTSNGRIFSAASASEDFPAKGQLGIPGLFWATRPEGPYDQPHEVSTLRGFEVSQIATGDYHSLALDKEGRVFAFGSNSAGQLGLDVNSQVVMVDAPSLLPVQKLYSGTNYSPRVTSIAAGGTNSFFTVDATRVAGPDEDGVSNRDARAVTADTFSCGLGIWGGLGNGRWTHVQGTPTKMKALSGLFEYDEKQGRVVPIRLAHISAGSTHACAVMDNVTYVGAHEQGSDNDTNWGADVLWWGGNEYFQLGTRKRNNVSTPIYIAPLNLEAERERGRREEHRFQITPRKRVKLDGRYVNIEQRVECGRAVSAIYSGV